jgi:hypothetical protein
LGRPAEGPPRDEDHLTALRARITALTSELEHLDATIATDRAALRAVAAEVRSLDGHADLSAPLALRRAELAARERELLATAAERTRVATEIDAHREHLAHPAPEAPDAHLSGATSAAPRDSVRRPRFLRVWAAVSTPLLVLTIVVLLTAPPWAFFTSVVVFAGLFLGVEAAARGRLVSFLVGLVLTGVSLTVVVTVVLGLLRNWQAVLAVLLTLAAVVLFAVNVRELRRG